jgi:hypothetical protein
VDEEDFGNLMGSRDEDKMMGGDQMETNDLKLINHVEQRREALVVVEMTVKVIVQTLDFAFLIKSTSTAMVSCLAPPVKTLLMKVVPQLVRF